MNGPQPGAQRLNKNPDAVFLSYASEDREAASAICAALRAAGVEVWFDQDGLRGGDAWDQKIRAQIRECTLFLPVISAHTQARLEGYFRLEWRIADQRTQLMARSRPFLLPICIDETVESNVEAPDSFTAVQWLRLKDGPEPLVARVTGLLSNAGSSSAPSKPVDALRTQNAEFEKSIAVLPFVDLSEKKDQQYFADGISEEILNLLGTIQGLRVIGRTSSFQFRGSSSDLRGIGAALGATYIVEGSVRPSGNGVRVTARLIDSRDGIQRWSETYVRDGNNLLKVQDEIAASLTAALQLEVTPHVISPLRARPTVREAYDAYLRGLHAAYRFDQRGFEEAIVRFRHALELDPAFVAPAEALAVTLNMLTEWQLLPPRIGFPQAKAAAELARAQYPESALAHAILGNIATYFDYDRAKAAAEIRTALGLAPKNPVVLVIAAKERLVLGEWEEALRLLNLAQSVDPLQPAVFVTRGVAYQRLMRNSDAERDFRRALEISPTYARVRSRIAEVLLAEGELEAAFAEVQQEVVPIRFRGLATVLYAMGRTEESDQALASLEKASGEYTAMRVAEVLAFRGDIDKAFEWLERAYEQRDSTLGWLKGNSLLASLVPDPRYKAFLKKMNLPE
jgi:TolB-like protein/Flp pilus assembly protein TadD